MHESIEIALLRQYVRNHAGSRESLPIVTALVALVSTQWLPLNAAFFWYAAMTAAWSLSCAINQRFLDGECDGALDCRDWSRRIVFGRALVMSAWALIVPIAWPLREAEAIYLLLTLISTPLVGIALLSSPRFSFFLVEASPLAVSGLGLTLASGRTELFALGAGYIGAMVMISFKMQRVAIARVELERELVDARVAAESANSALEHLAATDPLTEALNRRAFLEMGQQELSRAVRYDRPLTLLALDVDHFKRINDRHGHDAGDAVLQAFCDIVRANLRDSDLFARLGGEEFAVLLPETAPENALKTAERLRQAVEGMRVSAQDEVVAVSVSIGVAALGPDAADVSQILNDADRALYAAKDGGRNRVVAASSHDLER